MQDPVPPTVPHGLRADYDIAGRYRLLHKLSSGGMGVVYVARDMVLDRLVALKMMTDEVAADPEGAARFEREAKALAQLVSDHAVQIHDYGVEAGVPYLIMELLHGEDLSAR